MALTRPLLREKGVTDKEILDFIMDEHNNMIDLAKETVEEKTKAAMQRTIDGLQKKLENIPEPTADGEDWKAKYEAEVTAHKEAVKLAKTEFDTFKQSVETEKTLTAKRTLAETKLAEAKALPSAIKFLVKEIPLDQLKDDGSNWDELHKPIMEANGDFYGKTETRGAGVATPPTTDNGKPSGDINTVMNNIMRGKGAI